MLGGLVGRRSLVLSYLSLFILCPSAYVSIYLSRCWAAPSRAPLPRPIVSLSIYIMSVCVIHVCMHLSIYLGAGRHLVGRRSLVGPQRTIYASIYLSRCWAAPGRAPLPRRRPPRTTAVSLCRPSTRQCCTAPSLPPRSGVAPRQPEPRQRCPCCVQRNRSLGQTKLHPPQQGLARYARSEGVGRRGRGD